MYLRIIKAKGCKWITEFGCYTNALKSWKYRYSWGYGMWPPCWKFRKFLKKCGRGLKRWLHASLPAAPSPEIRFLPAIPPRYTPQTLLLQALPPLTTTLVVKIGMLKICYKCNTWHADMPKCRNAYNRKQHSHMHRPKYAPPEAQGLQAPRNHYCRRQHSHVLCLKPLCCLHFSDLD